MSQQAGPQAALQVQGLTAFLEGPAGIRRVLQAVDLEVAAGQTFALLGESGSGKTFLLHSLLGLHRGKPGVVSGRASILGKEVFAGLDRYIFFEDAASPRIRKDVTGWSKGIRRNLAGLLGRAVTLVPQDPLTCLSPFHSVGRMLDFAVRMGRPELGRASARDVALSLLDRVQMYGVNEVTDRYVHELSGGMAQRVALALALAPGPRLLAADEPTTGLDATLRVHILDLLGSAVEEQDLTLLLITHDMETARLLATQAGILCGGQMVELGPCGVVLDPAAQPKHPYTRYLLDAERRLAEGGGEPEPERARPKGPGSVCSYLGRCPMADGRCEGQRPPMGRAGPSHWIACGNLCP